MKCLAVFIILIACVIAVTDKKLRNRHVFTSENDPLRFKSVIVRDSKGDLHFNILTPPPPETRVGADEVTLYLYTQKNINQGIHLNLNTPINLEGLNIFNPDNDFIFICHGWTNDYESNVNKQVKNAILKTKNANVFVIDWSGPANKLYSSAVSAVPKVGKFIGEYINRLMDKYNLSSKSFKLIGHSLGAHVVGCAGAAVNDKVDYIIGLDPAGPLFTLNRTDNRLDETDAEFVQVIHTSIWGFRSSLGHSDFYPNNGLAQPGCGFDILGTCAHQRAYSFYEDSILSGGFIAKECHTYRAYNKGQCDSNDSSYFGGLSIDTSAYGDYYLKTEDEPPFAPDN